jgi:predicted nucleic acid-binding Zn ribbon protein
MLWEVAAAAALGLFIVWLVVSPIVRPRMRAPRPAEPPEPEETRRGAAVAALREIEFDRETGKLSDDDYASLKAKYTGEALAALRAEGSGNGAPDLEAMISARVRSLSGGNPPPCPTCGPRPEPDAAFCSTCGLRLDTGRSCGSCGAAIPPDSAFCDRCGARVAA